MIPETVVSANALDLLKFYTIVTGGVVGVGQAMIVNPEMWVKISAKGQAAIRAISGERLAHRFGDDYQKVNNEAYAAMKKANYTIQELSPQVLAQLKDKLKSSDTDWVAAAKAKGAADPAAALGDYRTETSKK